MKLKTSFFNLTVLKKDLTRFSPLWGVYTVLMLLFLMILGTSEGTAAQIASTMPYILVGMGILNFIYAGICAVCLFSDLYQSRMTNMLHALPMRREGWFLTHAAAGLLFCLIPNLIGTVIASFMTGPYCWAAFLWLAVMILEYIVFFGIGVFCVVCAGNNLGAIAMYALVNFLAPLGAFLVGIFYQPSLYGVEIDRNRLCLYSPVVKLSGVQFLEMEYNNMNDTTLVTTFYGETWRYLAVAVAVGLALGVAALLIYRKRHLESAGEMIAWKPAAPVLLSIYTLLIASMFYSLAKAIAEELVIGFLLVGLALGYFIGKMLLEKRVKVFHKRNIIGYAIFAGVFLVSLALTALDPLGVTRYVPDTDQVESVSVSPYGSAYSISNQGTTLTEPSDIDLARAIHREAIDNRPGDYQSSFSVYLRYTLKSGREVLRSYQMYDNSDAKATLKQLYSRPKAILGYDDPQALLQQLRQINLYFYEDTVTAPGLLISNYRAPNIYVDLWDDPYIEKVEGSLEESQAANRVIDALFTDCAEGNVCTWENNVDIIGQLELIYEVDGKQISRYVDITPNFVNLMKYLDTLEPTTE